jgi:crotonobetainyl-CoA:carnitine CoA-transferase CaiB-like acyl-CoA transferase
LNFAGGDRRAVIAPVLGQHTEEVLRDVAGCTDEQLMALFAAGAAVGPQSGG